MELLLIILQDGMYKLISTGSILENSLDCFDYCDIWRNELTTYLEHMNRHVIIKGEYTGAHFFGCLCE
jgi:hypothetical protein